MICSEYESAGIDIMIVDLSGSMTADDEATFPGCFPGVSIVSLDSFAIPESYYSLGDYPCSLPFAENFSRSGQWQNGFPIYHASNGDHLSVSDGIWIFSNEESNPLRGHVATEYYPSSGHTWMIDMNPYTLQFVCVETGIPTHEPSVTISFWKVSQCK